MIQGWSTSLAGKGFRRLAGLALAVALAACGGAPAPAPPEFQREWLVPPNVLQRWHEDKALLGPTFAGSPAWRRYVEFIVRELRDRGVVDVVRDPVNYQRWHTADDPAAGQWSLTVDGRDVPVAAYWAYSGSTSDAGVTAPLVYFDPRNPPDVKDRVVVFDASDHCG